ncbi:MIS12 [Lepeophtheirus salmonis]|uniref:Protein MIS12 homolog n=1 Tax=Lepeophtheirus salmonis TaxID=72036 RepID=A0A7R8CT18_LEPSM|nr:MIS12 [Lepeophtheirus salmonis]CAF2919409.1 MIS12 [Lepeophtheirus salmonis]
MDKSGNEIQEEYSTQHFGFPPKTFLDNIGILILERVSNVLKGVQTVLMEKCPDSKDSIPSAMSHLQKDWLQATQESLLQLNKVLLQEILIVPKDFVLPEDRVHVGKRLSEEKKEFKILSAMFEDKLFEIKRLHAYKKCLEEKVSELTSIDEEYSKLLEEWNSKEAVLDIQGLDTIMQQMISKCGLEGYDEKSHDLKERLSS